jgi:hypothetical protein
MKVGTKVKALGYRLLKKENKDDWPEWLLTGTHQVSKIRKTAHGLMVKTDRQHEFWMSANWFTPIA